jgi:hypothetical protein
MKNKLIILILFFSVISIFSCRDRCSKYVTVDIENDNAKSYFNYNKNSYWIYTDSLGQITDTFFVSNLYKTYNSDNKPFFFYSKCYYLERIKCEIVNKNELKKIILSAELSLESKKEERITINYWSNFSIEGSFVLYNTDNVFLPHFEFSGGGVLLDTMTVNSITYNNVIKFSVYDTTLHLFVAKDIGIVKITTADREYNLLNYEIK